MGRSDINYKKKHQFSTPSIVLFYPIYSQHPDFFESALGNIPSRQQTRLARFQADFSDHRTLRARHLQHLQFQLVPSFVSRISLKIVTAIKRVLAAL